MSCVSWWEMSVCELVIIMGDFHVCVDEMKDGHVYIYDIEDVYA
jgi:hypothetical protein